MNCSIVVEMKEGNTATTRTYLLDDYRIAQAICNIMDNVEHVSRIIKRVHEKEVEDE